MSDPKAGERLRSLAATVAAWHLACFFLLPAVHLILVPAAHGAHDCPLCTSLQQPFDELAEAPAAAGGPVLAAGASVIPALDEVPSATPLSATPARAPPAA